MEILRFCLKSTAAQNQTRPSCVGAQTWFCQKPPPISQNRDFHKAGPFKQHQIQMAKVELIYFLPVALQPGLPIPDPGHGFPPGPIAPFAGRQIH